MGGREVRGGWRGSLSGLVGIKRAFLFSFFRVCFEEMVVFVVGKMRSITVGPQMSTVANHVIILFRGMAIWWFSWFSS